MSGNGNGNDTTPGGGHLKGSGSEPAQTANHGSNALTPFEFALAGVAPPSAQPVASLRVVQDMRALVDGTDDAPISHAGLQDFLDSGGRLSLGGERRRRLPKSTGATTGTPGRIGGTGAFIDITPPDMVRPAAQASGPEAAPAAGAALAGVAPTTTDTDPEPRVDASAPPSPIEDTPTQTPTPISSLAESEAGDRSIDAVQADLQALLAGSDVASPEPIEPSAGEPSGDESGDASMPAYLVGNLVTGPIAGLTADPGLDQNEPIDIDPHDVGADDLETDDLETDGLTTADLATNDLDTSDLEPAGLDPATEPNVAGETPDLGPASGDATDRTPDPVVLGSTTDGLRADDGRFGPVEEPDRDRSAIIAAAVAAAVAGGAASAALNPDGDSNDVDQSGTAAAAARPPGPAADAEGDTPLAAAGLLAATEPEAVDEAEPADVEPVAVGAAGAGTLGLLESPGGHAPPMVATVPAPLVTTVSRRPGGALLALVGAGTAAAVLLAGTLWWANSSTSTSTEADPAESETAAAPSTTESEVLAGSLSGPAERSTGDDDEPAEFQGDGEATPSTLTVTSTPNGSADGPTTTTGDGGATSAPTVTTTSAPTVTTTSSSSTTASTSGTASTAAPTTQPQSTSTTQPTTTTAAPLPIYIGDQVNVGGYNGPPLAGVQVSLYTDDNRDGRGDRQIANRTTDRNGRYSFDQPAGCFEIRFTAPDGYEIRSDLSRQALCLEAGDSNARVDAIAELLAVAAPRSCVVEEAGNFAGLGVEISENGNNWAESYTFYTRAGTVVARTRNLGPFDTDPGEDDREWFGAENGFNHRDVWSVAAERGGNESPRITCSRL